VVVVPLVTQRLVEFLEPHGNTCEHPLANSLLALLGPLPNMATASSTTKRTSPERMQIGRHATLKILGARVPMILESDLNQDSMIALDILTSDTSKHLSTSLLVQPSPQQILNSP